MDLASLQNQLAQHAALQAQPPSVKGAPVHLWNPPFCGHANINIASDGTWYYSGTPISRIAMVRLFSSVLKKEQQDYFLVTPVEKIGIRVDDVPFVITEWQQQDGFLRFTTKEGIEFVVSEDNPVELRRQKNSNDTVPYVLIRDNLFARLHQNVFYQLVDLGTPSTSLEGVSYLAVQSGDYIFSLGSY